MNTEGQDDAHRSELRCGVFVCAVILKSMGLTGLAVFGVLAAIASFGLFVGRYPAAQPHRRNPV